VVLSVIGISSLDHRACKAPARPTRKAYVAEARERNSCFDPSSSVASTTALRSAEADDCFAETDASHAGGNPAADNGAEPMRTIHLAILAGLMTLTGLRSAQAEKWTIYGNAHFGTFADYPAERFAALPPPDNGDGQMFQARDGATLTIFGGYNINDETPTSYEASLRPGPSDKDTRVTYRATGKDWLVLSGLRGTNIFYEKELFRGDIIHSMVLTYPQSLKVTYDPIAAHIARSLRAHKVYLDGKCFSGCTQK
jgi:hypothetical protein